MTSKILILSLSFFCCFAAHAGHGDSPIVFKGSVIEEDSGDEIIGATITLEEDGKVVQTIQSDKDGNFVIEYETPKSTTEKTKDVKIKISKPGFKAQDVNPVAENPSSIKVELKKKPEFKPFTFPSSPHQVYDL